MKGKYFVLAALAVAMLVASASAAEITKITGVYYMNDPNGWVGGVVPTSSDVAVFDGTNSVPSGAEEFRALSTYIGGYKVTDITGDLSINSICYNYGFGLDASAATADITFEHFRNNAAGFGPITIAAGRTFTTGILSTAGGKSAYTIPISGGGTMLVTDTATGNSSRVMFDVSGVGTTIGGTGTWRDTGAIRATASESVLIAISLLVLPESVP